MPKGRAKSPEVRAKYGRRAVNDTYVTELSVIRAILDSDMCNNWLSPYSATIKYPLQVLDLCAGPGNWGQVARWMADKQGTYLQLTGVELNSEFSNPGEHDLWVNTDFLTWETEQKFDLIISNPPFSKETLLPIIDKAISLLYTGSPYSCAVFLLPVSFLASKIRAKFFKLHMPVQIYSLVPRPSFFRLVSTSTGTDTDEYIVVKFTTGAHKKCSWQPLEWERDAILEARFKQNLNYNVAKRIYEDSRTR